MKYEYNIYLVVKFSSLVRLVHEQQRAAVETDTVTQFNQLYYVPQLL